jgi:hypothetical protein
MPGLFRYITKAITMRLYIVAGTAKIAVYNTERFSWIKHVVNRHGRRLRNRLYKPFLTIRPRLQGLKI